MSCDLFYQTDDLIDIRRVSGQCGHVLIHRAHGLIQGLRFLHHRIGPASPVFRLFLRFFRQIRRLLRMPGHLLHAGVDIADSPGELLHCRILLICLSSHFRYGLGNLLHCLGTFGAGFRQAFR